MKKLVFIHAEWCGPCRFCKANAIDRLSEEYPGRVELIDAMQGVPGRYKVEGRLPVIIVEKDGEEWWRGEGVANYDLLKGLMGDD